MTETRPDVGAILAGLKPFQRATVNHGFDRLWGEDDPVRRFLVADEVGLGKTMVAKGIAARAIDHLWDSGRPITVLYICSNAQIARQNLRRLRDLTGGELQDNADRLTMLPATLGREAGQRLQLVAFSPGTSLNLGNSTGMVAERALLHWMLRHVLGSEEMRKQSWTSYLAVGVQLDRFRRRLRWQQSRPELDPGLVASFAEHLDTERGPLGGTLREDLLADQARWARTPHRSSKHRRSRRPVIGALRMAMAHVAVGRLSPDLVILDEFQRFRELFPSADRAAHAETTEAQRLAQRLIATERAKVLVLSATPYKMFTLPDDPSGDDHYRDFTHTIEFLAGPETARGITRELKRLREGILLRTPEGHQAAAKAQRRVQAALRRVMSRTERLAATPHRDGMLTERSLGAMTVESQDIEGWLAADALARQVGTQDAFEFWRSAPYTANLMHRNGYQMQERFLAAAQQQDRGLIQVLREQSNAFLDWEEIRQYRPIKASNAKMRALVNDLTAHEAWRLAWMAPSLPYLEPAGVFASPAIRGFTKRLIFSAWNVVPKAIAAMVSYEAERRLREESGAVVDAHHRYGDRRTGAPLAFGWDADADVPRNLPNLTVLYPCVTLAQLGDPLALARDHGWRLPLDRDAALEAVTEQVRQLLAKLGIVPQPGAEGQRRRWYGAAPYLLDAALDDDGSARQRIKRWLQGERREGSRLVDHMRWAMEADRAELGAPPEDLAHVLAEMALAGPGVCALRALARVEDGARSLTDPQLRVAAVTASRGLRSLFNKAEIVSAVRGGAGESTADADSYWHQVLRYSLDGNLQSVLDEFVHMLTESEGLGALSRLERSEALADRIAATASIRPAKNTMQDVRVDGDHISVTERSLSSHLAARFGRVQSSEASVDREATVREGYTSPLWPFVMASTSVGQEGLDFHTYSHAVVHWNLPGNPVDMEQREGRVHRYKGHAVRKNVAAVHGESAVTADGTDPWRAVFAAAEATRPAGDSLINPYWVFPLEGGATIKRYVPAMPLSQETQRYAQLRTTLGAYRFVMGQPRQEDLIRYLGADAENLRIDLTPPAGAEE